MNSCHSLHLCLNRRLTDKPKDEKHEPVEVMPEFIEDLGKGNHRYLPIFMSSDSSADEQNPTESVDTMDGVDVVDNKEPVASDDGTYMVMYKGAMIDVAKLMQQMARAELVREQTEQRIKELIRSNNDLQSSSTRAKDKIKDLQSELKSCNRKLSEAESNLSGTNVSLTFHDLNSTKILKLSL